MSIGTTGKNLARYESKYNDFHSSKTLVKIVFKLSAILLRPKRVDIRNNPSRVPKSPSNIIPVIWKVNGDDIRDRDRIDLFLLVYTRMNLNLRTGNWLNLL